MTFDIKSIDLERFRNAYIDALKRHLTAPVASYCYSPNALTPEEKCVLIGVEKEPQVNMEDEDLSDERIKRFLKFHLSRFNILKKIDLFDYAYGTIFIYNSIRAELADAWEHLWTKAWPASTGTFTKNYEDVKNSPADVVFDRPPRLKVDMSK